jgi:glycosidase
VLQYTLPGSPSLYYADEAEMEGYKDPFNRRTYPWGQENALLLEHFRQLGKLKKQPALMSGSTEFVAAGQGRLHFVRSCGTQKVRIYVNRGESNWEIPAGKILYSAGLCTLAPQWMHLEPMGFAIVEE